MLPLLTALTLHAEPAWMEALFSVAPSLYAEFATKVLYMSHSPPVDASILVRHQRTFGDGLQALLECFATRGPAPPPSSNGKETSTFRSHLVSCIASAVEIASHPGAKKDLRLVNVLWRQTMRVLTKYRSAGLERELNVRRIIIKMGAIFNVDRALSSSIHY
jgi:hypothetical protein